MTLRSIVAGALAAPLALGCASSSTDRPVASTTRVTSAASIVDPAARLALEVCARAASCDRIGGGRRYESTSACVDEVDVRASSEIAGWRCSDEDVRARVATCIATVRTEPCGVDVASPAAPPVCGRAAPCAR